MSSESKAIALASEAHKGDLWGDQPYLVHVALVAARVREILGEDAGNDNHEIVLEDAVNVAWLHDTIEDHPEYDERVGEEFPHLLSTLRLLARDRTVSYGDYVQNVIDSGDRTALLVKLSDMFVNMSNSPSDSLLKRYQKNYKKLVEAWLNKNEK